MARDCDGIRQRGRLWYGLLLIWVVSTCSLDAWAQRTTLRIGYVEFPPYEYQDEQGNAAGSFIELTRRVALEAGYQPEFIYLPPSRLYLYLREGRIDLWPGLSYIPPLQGHVLVSKSTPMMVELSAWYLKGTAPVTRFDDLRDRRIILISGYTYGGLSTYLNRQPDIRLSYSSTHRSAVDMLRLKRGDYLLDYREPVEALADHQPIDDIRHSFVRNCVAAWLFSIEGEKAQQYQKDFDRAFARLKARGELSVEDESRATSVLPGFPNLPPHDVSSRDAFMFQPRSE